MKLIQVDGNALIELCERAELLASDMEASPAEPETIEYKLLQAAVSMRFLAKKELEKLETAWWNTFEGWRHEVDGSWWFLRVPGAWLHVRFLDIGRPADGDEGWLVVELPTTSRVVDIAIKNIQDAVETNEPRNYKQPEFLIDARGNTVKHFWFREPRE